MEESQEWACITHAVPAASSVSLGRTGPGGTWGFVRSTVPELVEKRGLDSSPDSAGDYGIPSLGGSSHPDQEILQPATSLRLSQASSKDTGQLYAALHHRILALRSRVEQEQEAKIPAPEPGAAPSNEDDSDEDVLAPSGATGGGEPAVPALAGIGEPDPRGWGSSQGRDLT